MSNIIKGDCLEFLKTLPDESIDCVITDPPYGDGVGYGRGDKTILNNDGEGINYTFLTAIYPKMKNNTTCYLFTNWKFETKLRNWLDITTFDGGGLLT